MDALVTTADTKGTSYSLPNTAGKQPWTIVWTTSYAVAPGAVSLQLQGALNDVDAEYAVLDTSTAVGGEMRHVAGIAVRFIRVRQVSRTGATAHTTVSVKLS